VLTRDRLLASYQVRPVLDKLRRTLLGAGVILLTSSVLLVGLLQTGTDEYGVYGECNTQPCVCCHANLELRAAGCCETHRTLSC
jgi:hypothetical protein